MIPVTAHKETAAASAAEDTTSAWVTKAQAGDLGAFEVLYQRHVSRVYALCLRMSGGDVGEAEELTQESFVRCWEKLNRFKGRSAFSSWLHRLTVNVVLSRWRAKGRRRVVAMGDLNDLRAPSHVPKPRLGVDLERAIADLPVGARTVFILYDVEGHRHRDIAEMTGLKVGTCKAQLHRARRLLRESLQ